MAFSSIGWQPWAVRCELPKCAKNVIAYIFWNSKAKLKRKSGNAQTGGVHLVTHVDTDEQCSQAFDDARIFQLAAIDGAGAGNLVCQVSGYFQGPLVVAANDDIAVNRRVRVQQVGPNIVKRRCDSNSGGNQLCRL